MKEDIPTDATSPNPPSDDFSTSKKSTRKRTESHQTPSNETTGLGSSSSNGSKRKRAVEERPEVFIRKPKSPYICFSLANQHKIRAQLGPNVSVGDAAKIVARTWNNLSEEERAIWEEASRRDRERCKPTSPEPVPSPISASIKVAPTKRPKKPSQDNHSTKQSHGSAAVKVNAIGGAKRPTPFSLFSQKVRHTIKSKNPNSTSNEVSKELRKRWKHISDDERSKFIKMADSFSNEKRQISDKARVADKSDEKEQPSAKKEKVFNVNKTTIPEKSDSDRTRSTNIHQQSKPTDSTSSTSNMAKKTIVDLSEDVMDLTGDDTSENQDYAAGIQRNNANSNFGQNMLMKQAIMNAAYNSFAQKMRPVFKAEHPEMTHNECSTAIGIMWKNLTDAERAPYVNLSSIDESCIREGLMMNAAAQQEIALSNEALLQHERAQLIRNGLLPSDMRVVGGENHPGTLGFVGMGGAHPHLRMPTGFMPSSHSMMPVHAGAAVGRPVMLDRRCLSYMPMPLDSLMQSYPPSEQVLHPQLDLMMQHPMDVLDIENLSGMHFAPQHARMPPR
eukprot:CAMPEP_0195525998 /NCGR_PEP_ID=MMETSP0794_2-20130614/26787_1 /TAXON_ID=515487 /ORGANISM="Stephanopyxis turris, Strain CCMP 815" /LENGTH=559 /DNA_ID=CAMNT_0040656593 /DNA_START=426 /DNA_END=2105 /DNA_ORIENTATION=-